MQEEVAVYPLTAHVGGWGFRIGGTTVHRMAAFWTSLELSINDLSCVVNVLTPVSHMWEAIGLQIGVRSHVLEAIKLEHSQNPAHCLLGMLKKHLSNIDPQPCWERFVKALRSDAVGETALARKLEIKFCPLPGSLLFLCNAYVL